MKKGTMKSLIRRWFKVDNVLLAAKTLSFIQMVVIILIVTLIVILVYVTMYHNS